MNTDPDSPQGAGGRAERSGDEEAHLLTAPPTLRYCVRCASALETAEVAGRPRRRCPACGHVHFVEPRVGVGVMVLERGRLLLVKRAMPPARGRWALPAGYLDAGESPEETAVREVAEETGLHVRLQGLVEVFHNRGQSPDRPGATLFLLYRGARSGGALRAADDALEAAFFGPAEIPEIAFESTHRAVRLLREGG